MELEIIDVQILRLLKQNAKISIKEIANKVGLSTTPVFERIKKLERTKIIESYTIKLNRDKIGKPLRILCQISLKEHSKSAIEVFEKEITELQEINECLHVAGNYDYLLILEMKDVQSYEQFLKDKLATMSNISNVNSSFVLGTVAQNGLNI